MFGDKDFNEYKLHNEYKLYSERDKVKMESRGYAFIRVQILPLSKDALDASGWRELDTTVEGLAYVPKGRENH